MQILKFTNFNKKQEFLNLCNERMVEYSEINFTHIELEDPDLIDIAEIEYGAFSVDNIHG